jgi:putative monooxygenase
MISARGNKSVLPGVEAVELKTFVSKDCGAIGFSTGAAVFGPCAFLPYHFHDCSEAITVLEGRARVLLEGRSYLLSPLDCVHVPAGLAHRVENEDSRHELLAFSAFASSSLNRVLVGREYSVDNRGTEDPEAGEPETIVRYERGAKYELSENAFFCDLFARRFGAKGICGGYGRFLPGASLPCHIHDFDESITIVKGLASCLVAGKKYQLSGYDTAFVPRGRPHRFLNNSNEEMAMIWVYAGAEPDRTLVQSGLCSGEILWTGEGRLQNRAG